MENANINNYSEESLAINLADQIREESHFRIVKDDNICGAKRTGQYLIYNQEKGKYDLTDSDGVKGFIRDCIQEHPFSRKLIENVFYNLITASDNSPYMIDVSQINNDEGIINFNNGIYDIATRTMLPHDPKYISTIQIPCSYTPSVKPACPAILKDFLLYCFDNDKEQIKLLFQFFGVAISNLDASSLKKALFIVGPGNTGKSLLRNLICELVGKEKCGTSDLSQLEQRFGASILYQKRIGGYSDMSADFINQVELFKNLTGGDDIPVEFKHQNRFSMRFKGLLLFTANKLPQFPSDTGDEVFDRMCIMKTVGIAYDKDKKPSPSSVEKDPAMLYKLLQDNVKRFFIYRAIQGLHEVINGHQYSITAKNDAYMKEYRESLNSVKSFLKKCCILKKDSPVGIDYFKTKTIYNVYCNWCGSVGLGDRILKQSVFNSELSRLGCGMSRFSIGYNCYTQFTLNQETRTNYHVCPVTKSMF